MPNEQGLQTYQIKRHQHLARQGEAQDSVYLLEDGWACRYRLLPSGQRQINALFLPGEYCEPQWILRPKASFDLVALAPLKVQSIALSDESSGRAIEKDRVKTILSAVSTMLDRQAEWMVSLGRKTALERLSGLLCELFDRMWSSGGTVNNGCFMPLTQSDLADITGLTAVHVNRMLQALRAQRLLKLEARWLDIPNLDALRRLSGSTR